MALDYLFNENEATIADRRKVVQIRAQDIIAFYDALMEGGFSEKDAFTLTIEQFARGRM